MRCSKNFTCLLLSVMVLPFCSSIDTITVGTIMCPRGNTLVSTGEWFELGFFSQWGGSDPRWYIGIWYYRSNPRIIVWVANRDQPLVGDTVSFSLVDGNLQLRDEGQPIWRTTVKGSSSSTKSAKLLDSGNLVLVEGDSILWQSFHHPTDTFLPGMRMRENFMLISWASQEDPRQGNFRFQSDPHGDPRKYEVISKLTTYWKSGIYDKFIQTDPMWYIISFLLSNFTPDATATSLQAAPSPTVNFQNVSVPSHYDYNNTRLVMSYDGRIRYFKQGNGSKPVWLNPADQCSVFNACGKFGSCNSYNGHETMCRCLPGFEPAEPDNWNSGDYSRGCNRKSPICRKNGVNSARNFSTLTMMRAGGPNVPPIPADSEEQCRQKCLDSCGCEAYSFHENQRQMTESSTLMCYTWSDDLDNIQELAQDGHDLNVRVQLSDIGHFLLA